MIRSFASLLHNKVVSKPFFKLYSHRRSHFTRKVNVMGINASPTLSFLFMSFYMGLLISNISRPEFTQATKAKCSIFRLYGQVIFFQYPEYGIITCQRSTSTLAFHLTFLLCLLVIIADSSPHQIIRILALHL